MITNNGISGRKTCLLSSYKNEESQAFYEDFQVPFFFGCRTADGLKICPICESNLKVTFAHLG
jgi:hypothetical protein